MAKKTSGIAATEHRIEDFAEDLGRMLGTARTKAEGWLGQRQAIVKNLTQLRDEATKLLADLGHEAAVAGRRGQRAVSTVLARAKRGRPVGSKNAATAAPRKKRKLSAKARKAMSDAQKQRWAKRRAEQK
jgi:hypothetical protein